MVSNTSESIKKAKHCHAISSCTIVPQTLIAAAMAENANVSLHFSWGKLSIKSLQVRFMHIRSVFPY